MKKCLLVLAMVFMLVGSASALPLLNAGNGWVDVGLLSDGTDYWTLDGNPNPTPAEIATIVGYSGTPLELVYKQDRGAASDSGSFAPYYTTNLWENVGQIIWSGPLYIEVDGVPAYLLVKDGMVHSPAIYIFDLGELGWDGKFTIDLVGFWSGGGAISHVSIYDPPDGTTSVPEPLSMILVGTGLIGMGGYGRKKFCKK